MVLDCVTIASTMISMLMNGICCMYQQQEEQKLRDGIRQDIRTEYMYHHHRHNDPQLYECFFDEEQDSVESFHPITVSTTTENLIASFNNKGLDLSKSRECICPVAVSTTQIQDERRVKLMTDKHQLLLRSNPLSTNSFKPHTFPSNDGPSMPAHDDIVNSCAALTISSQFHHEELTSPFSTTRKVNTTDLDNDEEIHSVMTSASWCTISIA
jgi:hypothetical protein